MFEQAGEAAQVLGIVVAYPAQLFGAAAAQIGEPGGRGFAAGQVVLAHHAEDLALDGGQAAIFPDAPPAAAGGMQQVDVGAADDGVGQAREGEIS